MPKIGEVEADDVRSAVLRHDPSLLKRARLTQGAFSRHFSSKKELLREAIDERVYSRAVHAGRVGILYWAERSLDSYFLASLQSLRFLRTDVCPIEKCLFNGRYARICAPGHGWRVSPGNAARGRDPDSKDPLAGKHGSGLDGSWFAVYPTIETLVAQLVAAVLVIGSYYAARGQTFTSRQNRGDAAIG